jgi:hypothetical protein
MRHEAHSPSRWSAEHKRRFVDSERVKTLCAAWVCVSAHGKAHSRLGRDQEHLDRTERFIRECKGYIDRQQSIVKQFEAGGYDATRAQALPEGLQVSLDLHDQQLAAFEPLLSPPLARVQSYAANVRLREVP